jgi:hypothetical protein
VFHKDLSLDQYYFCYILNDIEYSKLLSFILFADDTTIFHSNSCLKHLINTIIQTELNKVEEWLNVNKLSLNIKKKLKLDVKININNQEIERVKCTTFQLVLLLTNV